MKDLIARRLADGGQILFDVDDVSVQDSTGAQPKIRFRHGGREQELDCDFIGGCDGFHGVCRPSIPAGVLTDYDREYPFGWLGILAQAPPPSEELIYCFHQSAALRCSPCARRRWRGSTSSARRTRTSELAG